MVLTQRKRKSALPTASDVMTTSLVTVHKTDSVDEVFSLLLRNHISGIPVVDESGHLEGIVTEYDLLALLQDAGSTEVSVQDVWTTKVITAHRDDPLPEIAEKFLAVPPRRLPVVDDDNRLVGIISRRDLVRYIRDLRIKIAARMNAVGS